MINENIGWCKKFQYYIYYNKKLDWLNKENKWKFDKIDAIFMTITISLFILTYLLKDFFVFLTLFIFYLLGILGHIRQIKNMPGDIESKLISPMLCFGNIFILLLFIAITLVLIGKLLN